MTSTARHDTWSAGEHYERYMGRWSRQIATRYLDWLGAPKDAAWAAVDVTKDANRRRNFALTIASVAAAAAIASAIAAVIANFRPQGIGLSLIQIQPSEGGRVVAQQLAVARIEDMYGLVGGHVIEPGCEDYAHIALLGFKAQAVEGLRNDVDAD